MSARSSSDFLIDENINIEDEVIKRIDIEKLLQCLKFLSKKDLSLIYYIYIQNRTEQEISKIFNITQQAVNKKKKLVLKKLHKLLKDFMSI